MLWIAPLIFVVVGALGAGAVHWLGRPVYVQDMVLIGVMLAAGAELSLIVIRMLKGSDQAAAAQAGLTGMVLLMFVSVGLLAAGRFMGLIANSAALTQWSAVFFLVGLILVAGEAIRTIRQAPAVSAKPGTQSTADKTGNEHA